MKTASMVLGIVSGAIAIIFGLALILGSAILMNTDLWDGVVEEWQNGYANGEDWQDDWDEAVEEWNDESGGWHFRFNVPHGEYPGELVSWAISFGGAFVLFGGIIALVGGLLGLIGGCIVKRKNVAAGVLMIIGAVFCFVGFFNVFSMLLFILAAIFAFVKERPKPAAAYAPPLYPAYPPPPYTAYPQQPPVPQSTPPAQEEPPQQQ